MAKARGFTGLFDKKPNFEKHLEVVKKYRPKYATVADLSEEHVSEDDIERALRQLEQISVYCDVPLIVPKLPGQIKMLPPEVAIGYSIPSSYGGAKFPIWEMSGRQIHLLGGSPRKQLNAYLHLSAIASVMSVDGNYAQLMATRYGEYWERDKWKEHPGVKSRQKDIYLECWRWSCRNLLKAWQRLTPVSAVA